MITPLRHPLPCRLRAPRPATPVGYYTYMWSLVIAKDLFSAFDRDDLFDPEVATRYRDRILAQGGRKDAADLVEDFLGRPFGFESFADWLSA